MKKKPRKAQQNLVSKDMLRAIELQGEGLIDEAEQLFSARLALNPRDALALYSMAVILMGRQDMPAALAMLNTGVSAAPAFALMWAARGSALNSIGRREDALASYDKAIELDDCCVLALLNSGVLLRDLLRPREALERFNSVLTIEKDNETALANCAAMLELFGARSKAIVMYKHLLALNPSHDYTLGLMTYQKLRLCDWTDHDTLTQEIFSGVRAGKRVCSALALMVMSDQASDHHACARTYAQHHFPTSSQQLWRGERYLHDKIRIAYVSPDLREHPVGHLMAGVLERHDKTRFETYAISLGSDDQSRLRARMVKAFDRFIDAELMETRQIAELLRSLEIDIAIDLGGLTTDTRTAIFSHRPAPVQVNYLGFPGTMGTDYMDVILADRHVIPPEHQVHYNEKVVYLPDSYLPTDSSVKISDRTPSRAECGLPETGFVFCSFSHDHKIAPDMFDVWMRLLLQVPGSVLWLMSRKDESMVNLRQEAQARGIDPNRLIFAGRVPLVEDHLARYRQADLFIDTYPYNAHTTAADALMAGLPVITCMGNAFPSRVAGSLLHAIGLPELITHSMAEYQELALDLATDRARLDGVRAKLAGNRKTTALFDTDRFCRKLEKVYSEINSQPTSENLGEFSMVLSVSHSSIEQEQVALERKESKIDQRPILCMAVGKNSFLFGLSAVKNLVENFQDHRILVICQDLQTIELFEKLALKIELHHAYEFLDRNSSRETQSVVVEASKGAPAEIILRVMTASIESTRVTYVHPSVQLHNDSVLDFDSDAIYILNYELPASYKYGEEIIDFSSMDLFSLPNTNASRHLLASIIAAMPAKLQSINIHASKYLDQLIAHHAEKGHQVRHLRPIAPWNFRPKAAICDALAVDRQDRIFMFAEVRRIQVNRYQLQTFSENQFWSECYQDYYVPYLLRLEGIFRDILKNETLPEQRISPVDSRISEFLFVHENLHKIGYRHLPAFPVLDISAKQNYSFSTVSISNIGFAPPDRPDQRIYSEKELAAVQIIFEKMKPSVRSVLGIGYQTDAFDEIVSKSFSPGRGVDTGIFPTTDNIQRCDLDLEIHSKRSFDLVLIAASVFSFGDIDAIISVALRLSKKFIILSLQMDRDTNDDIHLSRLADPTVVAESYFSEAGVARLLAQRQLQPVLFETKPLDEISQALSHHVRLSTLGCLLKSDPRHSSGADQEEFNHYCAYFDSNYLTRAVLMIESLLRHDPAARFHLFCLDAVAENFFRNYDVSVDVISVAEIEAADPEFAACKANRSLVEWYFTATAVLPNYIFQKFPNLARLTYLDSDLYFFCSPAILHTESIGKSVQIIEHRFSPHMQSLERYGRFNVAWISFFNNAEGLRVVRDYRADCLEWCHDWVEDHRFADQKYLDKWPQNYPNCCVSRWIGADVAHWNVAQWELSYFEKQLYIGSEQLIFYHFQGVKLQEDGKYSIGADPERFGPYYQPLYAVYLAQMDDMEKRLEKTLRGVTRKQIRNVSAATEESRVKPTSAQFSAISSSETPRSHAELKDLPEASHVGMVQARAEPSVDELKDVKNSICFVGTCYSAFIDHHYSVNPELVHASYRVQLDALLATGFGDADFYSRGMILAGWRAADVIFNCIQIQTAWARENNYQGDMLGILVEQVRQFGPDVIYLQDLSLARSDILDRLRPHTRLIVGQIASPVPASAQLQGLDIIISSFPHFVERFRNEGICAYYQPLAFDSRILGRLGPRNPTIDFSFVGGISAHHAQGTQLLTDVAALSPLQVWGYGSGYLASDSLLRARHHGEAWGLDMFKLLRSSRITLNRHIDTAEKYANNMRLFEATGTGALLITDNKENLGGLFRIGEEVVVYSTAEECAALVTYYLNHLDEAEAIAKAGQARTLRDHSYDRRMEHTAEIFDRHLRQPEARRYYGNPGRISYGHQTVNNKDIQPEFSQAWRNPAIPARQRALVELQLAALYEGKIVPIFQVLSDLLNNLIPSDGSILEIGCSSGYYYEILEYLLNRRIRYLGVDYSDDFVRMARKIYPTAQFEAADGASLPFPDRSFPVVISSCLLLHVSNYREHIQETARVAQNYIVAHRTPVCRARPTKMMKKFAYEVETIEFRFNEKEFLMLFSDENFILERYIEYSSNFHSDEFEASYLFRRANSVRVEPNL